MLLTQKTLTSGHNKSHGINVHQHNPNIT